MCKMTRARSCDAVFGYKGSSSSASSTSLWAGRKLGSRGVGKQEGLSCSE